MAAIGRVLLIPKGDYSGSATYNMLDWVRDNGAAWVCKVDNTVGVAPPTLPATYNANWQLLSADGSVSGSIDWSNVNNKPFDTVGTGLSVDANKEINLDTSYLVASNLSYDNTASGLSSSDVQDAIDEVNDIKLTGTLFDTETSADGQTVTFRGINTSKNYLLIADLPNNYNGAPVGLSNIEIANSGGVYSVTYTVTNGTANQSFDLYEIG